MSTIGTNTLCKEIKPLVIVKEYYIFLYGLVVQWLGSLILVANLSQVPTFEPLKCCVFFFNKVQGATSSVRFMSSSPLCFFLLPCFGLPALTMATEAVFRRQYSSDSNKGGCFQMHRIPCTKFSKRCRVCRSSWPFEFQLP